MANIMILNGTSRKNGNTAALIKAFSEGAWHREDEGSRNVGSFNQVVGTDCFVSKKRMLETEACDSSLYSNIIWK